MAQAEKMLRGQYDIVVKENKGLTEQAALVDAEVWELREELNEQKTLVASIIGAIDDLKASTGEGHDVVRAAGKVQNATKDNTFAVSTITAFTDVIGVAYLEYRRQHGRRSARCWASATTTKSAG